MPYIKQDRRDVVDSFEGVYGDLVYYFYNILVGAWKAYPSFSRYFQMRHLVLAHRDSIDADIRDAIYDKNGNFRIPAPLVSISHWASYAYLSAVEELKRRYVDPYEDQKCKENGDVV